MDWNAIQGPGSLRRKADIGGQLRLTSLIEDGKTPYCGFSSFSALLSNLPSDPRARLAASFLGLVITPFLRAVFRSGGGACQTVLHVSERTGTQSVCVHSVLKPVYERYDGMGWTLRVGSVRLCDV